jgi:hypothetical protein
MKKIPVFLVLALLATVAALPAAAQARGALDPSFGDGGRMVRETPSRLIFGPTQVGQSPSGTIYTLYRGSLLAFEPEGSTDQSFGTGGVVPLLDRIPLQYGTRLTVDSQGRLIVAGSVNVKDYDYATPVIAEHVLAVTRLLPDGSPDPTFNGGEVVLTDLGLPEAVPPPGAPAYVRGGFSLSVVGVAVDDSDRIVVTGNRVSAYDGNKNGLIPSIEGVVARLDSSGGLDRTYATGGVGRGFAPQAISGSAAAPNGSLYILYRVPARAGVSRIVRLTPNGFPARSFGGTSGVQIRSIGEVEMTTDGKGRLTIVDPGQAAGSGLLATVTRFRLDGRPAAAFGMGGHLSVRFPRAKAFTMAIAGDRSGGAFLAASVMSRSGGVKRFALVHLTRKGSIDGRFATGFGADTKASVASLSVDRLGRPLVAGDLNSPLLPGRLGLAMARYLPN